EVAPGLMEIDYGEWEGLTSDECAARDPELRAAWEADPYATRTPGGESGADVAGRAFPILSGIREWLAGEATRCAIVVAHNHVNRLWLTALIGWPMADYRRRLSQDPAGYSLIGFDGGVPLVRRLNASPSEH
ncbi:MAG: histidine phosphatase family protein, partial [Candidatus Limnocylindria bacterium]